MKIKFYAHASFRLEGDVEGQTVSIVTDPYTPGPQVSNFDPINEEADLVFMSSATDRFHSDPSHILGNPTVINAVEVAQGEPQRTTVKGVTIEAIPSKESLTWDFGRDPEDNAMSLFTLEDIRFLHIGDIGNPLSEEQLSRLSGQVDVIFALAGANATIALDDLDAAIQAIQPRIIIPMHYFHPKGRLKILPVTEFISRYPAEMVTYVNGSELELTKATLPSTQHIYVLEQSR